MEQTDPPRNKVLFGLLCQSGVHLWIGDLGNMLATVVIFLPNFLYPYLYCPSTKPVVETFWFKYLVWMFVFTFVASYFWSEYFFDVLGMKYNFSHLSWNFDSALLGKGQQRVPLMMFIHAWYFFITYHTCSVVFMRVVRQLRLVEQIIPDRTARLVFATLLSAFFFAWGEIKFTTMDAIKDQFEYKDMDWALTWGASLYACYFLASFPLVQHLDEEVGVNWTLTKVVENSLAAGMIGFLLIDLFVKFGMPNTWERGWW